MIAVTCWSLFLLFIVLAIKDFTSKNEARAPWGIVELVLGQASFGLGLRTLAIRLEPLSTAFVMHGLWRSRAIRWMEIKEFSEDTFRGDTVIVVRLRNGGCLRLPYFAQPESSASRAQLLQSLSVRLAN